MFRQSWVRESLPACSQKWSTHRSFHLMGAHSSNLNRVSQCPMQVEACFCDLWASRLPMLRQCKVFVLAFHSERGHWQVRSFDQATCHFQRFGRSSRRNGRRQRVFWDWTNPCSNSCLLASHRRSGISSERSSWVAYWIVAGMHLHFASKSDSTSLSHLSVLHWGSPEEASSTTATDLTLLTSLEFAFRWNHFCL